MSLSKRDNWILIISLILLNLLFRIPWASHGCDIIDSTYIWSLANSILNLGHVKWDLHPASFFGLYPLSYPSALPIVLSITSQMSGESVECTIQIYGIVLGMLGLFGSYAMGIKFKKHILFAFFVAFAFSTAPMFVELTRWTASARNLFLALLPLLFWAIFWYSERKSYLNRQLLLIIVLIVTIFASHRMSFLISIIVAAYLSIAIIWHLKDRECFAKWIEKLSQNTKHNLLVFLFLFAFALQFTGLGFYRDMWAEYQTGAFAQGDSIPHLLLNLSSNYVGQVGALIFFGAIGLISLLRKSEWSFNESFVIVTLLYSTAFLAHGMYMALFLLPLISLLIASFLCELVRWFQEDTRCQRQILPASGHFAQPLKRNIPLLITICLLTSIVFSGYMIQRHMFMELGETGDKTWMTDDIIHVGLFLKEQGENAFLCNDGLIAGRIYASTGVPYLSGDIMALINNWIKRDELKMEPVSINSWSIYSKKLFNLISDPQIESDSYTVYRMDSRDSNSKKILNRYDIHMLVVNNKIANEMVTSNYNVKSSDYVKSATSSGNRIYDNRMQSVWHTN